MSNIEQALGRLFHTLDGLETAADQQEQEILRLRQQDLFNNEQIANANNAVSSIDPALLADKLDAAIYKIEGVLKEG